MTDLPSGTVTFLFTDIEGSTRLLQASGNDYPRLLLETGDLEARVALLEARLAADKG